MKKMVIEAKIKLHLVIDKDADLQEVMDEMEYIFEDRTGKADVPDTELLDYEVKDAA